MACIVILTTSPGGPEGNIVIHHNTDLSTNLLFEQYMSLTVDHPDYDRQYQYYLIVQ